ncbi:MAG: FAD-dependent oxidoreductase [Pirellulales bacterium]
MSGKCSNSLSRRHRAKGSPTVAGAEETLRLTPAANPTGLIGGMFSNTEACVNPRTASARIAAWLAQQLGVRFHFSTTVTQLKSGYVETSCGRVEAFDRIVVCSGTDFETLFPSVFAAPA